MFKLSTTLTRARSLVLAGLVALAIAGPVSIIPAANTPVFAEEGPVDKDGCWYGDPDPRCRMPAPWQP